MLIDIIKPCFIKKKEIKTEPLKNNHHNILHDVNQNC